MFRRHSRTWEMSLSLVTLGLSTRPLPVNMLSPGWLFRPRAKKMTVGRDSAV